MAKFRIYVWAQPKFTGDEIITSNHRATFPPGHKKTRYFAKRQRVGRQFLPSPQTSLLSLDCLPLPQLFINRSFLAVWDTVCIRITSTKRRTALSPSVYGWHRRPKSASYIYARGGSGAMPAVSVGAAGWSSVNCVRTRGKLLGEVRSKGNRGSPGIAGSPNLVVVVRDRTFSRVVSPLRAHSLTAVAELTREYTAGTLVGGGCSIGFEGSPVSSNRAHMRARRGLHLQASAATAGGGAADALPSQELSRRDGVEGGAGGWRQTAR